MPLFDFICEDGHVRERLFRHRENVPFDGPCRTCGGASVRMVSKPAMTPGKWGDQTGKHGINGHYDKGLGARYYTSAQRDALMEEKGLLHASDVGGHFIEDKMSSEADDFQAHRKVVDAYKGHLKASGGDKGKAVAKTFTVSQMKESGHLENTSVKGD